MECMLPLTESAILSSNPAIQKQGIILQKKISFLTIILLVLYLGILSGCSIGPTQLPGNRLAYNMNIQSSDNEEMLLNLIRARNDEPPLFLQVGAVTSSFAYESSAGFNVESSIGTSSSGTIKPSTGLAYSERPTISYTPLQGQDFVTNLLAEIPLNNLAILYRAGWDVNVLMWVAVSRLGKVANLDSFIPTGSNHPNTYSGFLKLTQLLEQLQEKEQLVFLAPAENMHSGTEIIMQVACTEEEAKELVRYLDEPAEQEERNDWRVLQFHLTTARNLLHHYTSGQHLTPIRLKSFTEILRELSVEGDPKRVLRSKIREEHGYRSGLIKTLKTDSCPANAFVCIPYGEKWYSIAKDDFKTKPIFKLLRTLYSLQAGNQEAQKPLLTLPVAN
jgi:hypothetical protein